MGWICKGCGDFNGDDSADTCKGCSKEATGSSSPQAPRARASSSAEDTREITESHFTAPDGEVKNARRKVVGIYHYRSPKSVDVPGTTYSAICPCQSYVNPSIVESKVELLTENSDRVPIIAVIFREDGSLGLAGDSHHTLVGALKAQSTIELQLVTFGIKHGPRNWANTTYHEFEENSAAARGSKLG